MRAFGPTNRAGSCLWCGARLRPITSWVEKRADESYEEWRKRKRTDAEVLGYGYGGSGVFCSLGCGYQFGKALAEHGRRLQPASG